MQKVCILLLTAIILTSGALAQEFSIQGDTLISLWRQRVLLNQQGFPERIDSLLAENIHFHFTRKTDGKDIHLKAEGLKVVDNTPKKIEWQAVSSGEELRMDVGGLLRSDGVLKYTITVTALQDVDLKDIVMHIPFEKEVATQMIGLGVRGNRPDSMYRWRWGVKHKDREQLWIGTGHKGLHEVLLGGATWANNGEGGIDVGIKGRSMLVNNYTGPRQLKKGDVLNFNFGLLIVWSPLPLSL